MKVSRELIERVRDGKRAFSVSTDLKQILAKKKKKKDSRQKLGIVAIKYVILYMVYQLSGNTQVKEL